MGKNWTVASVAAAERTFDDLIRANRCRQVRNYQELGLGQAPLPEPLPTFGIIFGPLPGLRAQGEACQEA
jgi:hypothetical protein